MKADPASSAPPSAFYLPQLDMLRFGAFALVFISHSFPSEAAQWAGLGLAAPLAPLAAALVHAGAFGVDLFFVLSAYLITTLLVREKAARGGIDLNAFWRRRGLRIWPLYYAALAGCFALQFVLPDERLGTGYLAAYLVLAGNWACVFMGFPNSAAAPLWSVGFEEQFYLTWPLLMRRLSGAALARTCAALIVVSVAFRVGLSLAHVRHEALWCNTLARLDPIAVGAWLALKPPSTPRAAAGPLAALAALGLVAAGAADGLSAGVLTPAFTYLGAALCSGGLVAACLAVTWRPGRLGGAVVYLGKVSFGLYVFHLAAIHVFDALATGDDALTAAARVAVPLAASVLAAAVSYEAYEKPFLRLKRRFTYIASRPL